MDPESEKPLRLFVNLFAIWSDFAFKTGEAMWASAHAAAVRANAPKVAVIPTGDAPAPKAQAPAKEFCAGCGEAARGDVGIGACRGPAECESRRNPRRRWPPRLAKAAIRHASKGLVSKPRAKLRSKAHAKRRAQR